MKMTSSIVFMGLGDHTTVCTARTLQFLVPMIHHQLEITVGHGKRALVTPTGIQSGRMGQSAIILSIRPALVNLVMEDHIVNMVGLNFLAEYFCVTPAVIF